MIKLLKNAWVHAPADMGRQDILVADGRIMAMADEISGWDGLDGVQVLDLEGMRLAPGLIDLHVHITGGGGEQGPSSRVPEITLSQLTLNGVTTVLGLLGTDGVTRSQENLLAKCRALCDEGITCLCLTGSYEYPTVTLTGGVTRDIALLDPCVGVKVAMSDHRSSTLSVDELERLGSQARLGGLISGKAGLVVIHVGAGKGGLDPLFQALERSDIPVKNFLPTHLGRNPQLIAQAVQLTQMGGFADFTAGSAQDGGAARIIAGALASGAVAEGITLSSDACGSQPRFDAQGNCIGLTYDTPAVLLDELRRMVQCEGLSLTQALRFLTENPARALGLEGVKGTLAVGADADLVAFDDRLSVRHVLARGKPAVWQGEAVMKGRFEV